MNVSRFEVSVVKEYLFVSACRVVINNEFRVGRVSGDSSFFTEAV